MNDVRYVVVSAEPRTLETALAMGFAVDELCELESPHDSGDVEFHEWRDWLNPWSEFQLRIKHRRALGALAARQVEIIREAATHVRPGEAVLVIGHGGWIELTVAAAVGRIPIEGYGPSLRNLEGVRLSFDEGKFEVDHVWRRAADHEGGNS